MADDKTLGRRDRARAFVPELIPEPQDLERSGPLDAKERQQLDRIHAARDHHQAARWMRGKALAAAFGRRLYRGETGERTRQGYLDDEWDGMSESAAYLEIREWPLAAQIAATYERPAPDSHVRALVDVAEAQGHEAVARWYADLRERGQQLGHRVTADVVANLADYLGGGVEPERLEVLFVPRQIEPAHKPRKTAKVKRAAAGEPVTGTVVSSGQGSFQNFGMSPDGSGPAAGPGRWTLSPDQVDRLSAWIADGAGTAGISPDRAAGLLVQALTDGTLQQWIGTQPAP